MSYMLDTDVCIYLLTDRAPEKRAHILSRQPDPPLLLSAVTVSELSYGVEKSKWRKANTALLDKFLHDFHIVPYDERAARICGVLRATLEKKGHPISPMDTLIAAHASAGAGGFVGTLASASGARVRVRRCWKRGLDREEGS